MPSQNQNKPTDEDFDNLYTAVIQGNIPYITRFFETFGTQDYINHQDGLGWTLLMKAVLYGHTSLITSLLENGASLEIETKNRRTALMIAEQNGRTQSAEILKQWPAELQKRQNTKDDALKAEQKRHDARETRIQTLKQKRVISPFRAKSP